MGRALADLDCEGLRRAGICSERSGLACVDFDLEVCCADLARLVLERAWPWSVLFRRLGAERFESDRRSSAE